LCHYLYSFSRLRVKTWSILRSLNDRPAKVRENHYSSSTQEKHTPNTKPNTELITQKRFATLIARNQKLQITTRHSLYSQPSHLIFSRRQVSRKLNTNQSCQTDLLQKFRDIDVMPEKVAEEASVLPYGQ